MQNWICFLCLTREQSFPGMLLLIKGVSFCAFEVKWKSLSRVRPFATPWTESLEFSRPEDWSGWPFPSPGDLPNLGLNPGLLHYRRILYQLSHQGSPRILEWVPLHDLCLLLKYFFHLTSLFHSDLPSYIIKCFKTFLGKFPAVPWWGLCACAAGDMGLIPDQRSKISQTAQHSHKNFLKFLTDFPNVKF